MASLNESIGRIIEVARRLRDRADELKDVELKSQIVDEISVLLEIRESLSADDTQTIATAPPSPGGMQRTMPHSKHDGGHAAARPTKLAAESAMRIIEPTGDSGTYSLHVDDDPPPVEKSVAATKPTSTPREPTREEVAAKAEMRIAELEPLQQATLKRQNDILTAEQTRIRVQATKQAKEQGKTGKEAAQFVIDALKLSPEQKTQWIAARKDLQAIREEIAKQVQFLMTDEQQAAIAD